MVRHYKSKRTRKTYSKETLEKAKELLNEGKSPRAIAHELKIEKMYLNRYVKKLLTNDPICKSAWHLPALPNELEVELANHLKKKIWQRTDLR